MFVNSCLCIIGTCNIDLGIMDWKSTCHGSVISAFMVQWFCPLFKSPHMNIISPFDIWTSYLQIMKCYDTVFDLNMNVGHYDIYFMVQWFCFISERPFDMNITPPDYEMVWPDNSPQYECTALWPIFHGPVILPYFWKPIWFSGLKSKGNWVTRRRCWRGHPGEHTGTSR